MLNLLENVCVVENLHEEICARVENNKVVFYYESFRNIKRMRSKYRNDI